MTTRGERDGATSRPVGERVEREPARRHFNKLIAFSEAEYAAIIARARVCRLTPARYIREASLGAIPRAAPDCETTELTRHIGRIGVELRRLAVTAEREGEFPIAAQLDEMRGELNAMLARALGIGSAPTPDSS